MVVVPGRVRPEGGTTPAESEPPGRDRRGSRLSGQRKRQVGHDGCVRWLPGIDTLRRYERAWLPHDLTAGIVLSTLLVPAGMAYAEASGLPPVNGLYATIVVLVVYALLGPSKILVLGPDSSLAPIIAAAVVPLAAGDPQRAVPLAAMLALMSGAICVLAGVARFGFVTDLLSLPVRHGYMNGIALTIIAIQLPKLFGFSASGSTALEASRNFVEDVADGDDRRCGARHRRRLPRHHRRAAVADADRAGLPRGRRGRHSRRGGVRAEWRLGGRRAAARLSASVDPERRSLGHEPAAGRSAGRRPRVVHRHQCPLAYASRCAAATTSTRTRS